MWGISGSSAVGEEDIVTMQIVSLGTNSGSKGRVVPALYLNPPKKKTQTLVPSVVPLEPVEAYRPLEDMVKSGLTAACLGWEIWPS